ncbi:MAG: hypothetical protein HKM02_01190, partial [Pseudomonadales bacterium]|nr:hypothetical protein [Pseudomonadales bacterium]
MRWQDTLNGWNEKLKQLSLRERLLVCLMPIVLSAAVSFDQLSRQYQSLHRQEGELKNIYQRTQTLTAEIATLQQQALHPSPYDPRLQQLRTQLQDRQQRLVSPSVMLNLIESVLASQQHVRIVSMESHQPEILAGSEKQPIYRHRITLQLQGSYFDVLHYLRILEDKGPLYWDSLH